MEFISSRVLDFVATDAKTLIKFLLENWYRPALSHHSIKLEDAFIKRRCFDWSFLNLHLNHRLVPGVVKLEGYARPDQLRKLDKTLSKCAGTLRFGYMPKSNDNIPIPKAMKELRPFTSNYLLLVNATGLAIQKDGLGDYIGYLSNGNSEVTFNDVKVPLKDGDLLISSYQSLAAKTEVSGKLVIFSNYRIFYPQDYQTGLIPETI